MVVSNNILLEGVQTLESLNLPIPDWVLKTIIFLMFLGLIYELIIKHIINIVKVSTEFIKAKFYHPETKRFVDIRNLFIDHLESEIKRLNREADWNDFYYTELEAEVEIDPSLDLDLQNTNNPILLLYSFFNIIRSSIGMLPNLKVEKNLTKAISRSKSRAFLVIGDPGSGKTVSLRHLFLEMAKKAASRNEDVVVPLYLNLKHLNVESDKIDADEIHNWVIEQLREGQDRSIHEFLDKNFEKMLKNGNFFFLFDSFDEIPAVMDAQEEQEAVRKYAIALDRFLHSSHCRGLVSSRPYRSPKIFIGQRMTIRPLSYKRTKKALYKYMGQNLALANKLWQELVTSREDMLYIAQNPFYLGLLARYSKKKQILPERHYDLFENFVQNRARTDETRLIRFGLKPVELIELSSTLAFIMTKTPHIGLEADVEQLREIAKYATDFDEINDDILNKLEPLLQALTFSKLGRLSLEETGKPRKFSFVHRRFHEYFCAVHLKQHPNIAPFEKLADDNRWREVLVLLCEVLHSDKLTRIFDTARKTIKQGIIASSGSIENKKGIETIRFLRDGFHNRIDDIPNDVRLLCSRFIEKQIESGNLLDKKRAIEGVSIADDESVHSILEYALKSDSVWLRETALQSCRILKKVPETIGKAVRQHLYHSYSLFEIHKNHSFYSILFSSRPSLRLLKSFYNILLAAFFIQILTYTGIIFYAFWAGISIISSTLSVIIIVFFYKYSNNFVVSEYKFNQIGQWIILSMAIPLFSIGNTSNIIYLCFALVVFNLLLFKLVSFWPKNISEVFLEIKNQLCEGFVNRKKLLGEIIGVAHSLIWVAVLLSFMFLCIYNLRIVKLQEYSFSNIYSEYDFILGTAIILLALLSFIFLAILLLLMIFRILSLFLKVCLYAIHIFFDIIKLKKLTFISNNRPSTAVAAIQTFHSFNSNIVKTQYIKALFKWLPIGTDPHVLIEEADKQSGIIRDKLYQLAEIWEDSTRIKS